MPSWLWISVLYNKEFLYSQPVGSIYLRKKLYKYDVGNPSEMNGAIKDLLNTFLCWALY